MKTICTVYKSPKKDEAYLYVDHKKGLAPVPKSLLEVFGNPIKVTTLVLTEDRKLARADVKDVIRALIEPGYYLQMPPAKESYLLDLHQDTSSKYDMGVSPSPMKH